MYPACDRVCPYSISSPQAGKFGAEIAKGEYAMAIKDLTPIEMFALRGSASENQLKLLRKNLSTGEYNVDFIVRVSGNVNVGQNYSSIIPNKFNWQKFALALADRVSDKTLKSALKEVKEKKERKFQKERTDNLFETLLEETRTDCNGKVVPKVFIDVIRPQRKE